jgi:hypothetical protein
MKKEKSYPSKLELDALKDISSMAAKNDLQFKFKYNFKNQEDNDSFIRLDTQQVKNITELIAMIEFSNGNLSRLSVRYNPSFSNELITDLENYEKKYSERNYKENIKNQGDKK